MVGAAAPGRAGRGRARRAGPLGPDRLNAAAVQAAAAASTGRRVFVVAAGARHRHPGAPHHLHGGRGRAVRLRLRAWLLAVVGTALAAAVALLAGAAGRRPVRGAARAPRAGGLGAAGCDRSGLLAMVSLRLIPAVPFSLLNYAAGAGQGAVRTLRARHGAGSAPGTVALVVLGDAVTGGASPGDVRRVGHLRAGRHDRRRGGGAAPAADRPRRRRRRVVPAAGFEPALTWT